MIKIVSDNFTAGKASFDCTSENLFILYDFQTIKIFSTKSFALNF